MKDLSTKKVYVSKAFRDQHQAKLAQLGLDLSKPLPAGLLLEKATELFDDAFIEVLVKELGPDEV